MSEYYGKEYNYDIFKPSNGAFEDFRSTFHAGDRPPDFTLPLLDGVRTFLETSEAGARDDLVSVKFRGHIVFAAV